MGTVPEMKEPAALPFLLLTKDPEKQPETALANLRENLPEAVKPLIHKNQFLPVCSLIQQTGFFCSGFLINRSKREEKCVLSFLPLILHFLSGVQK